MAIACGRFFPFSFTTFQDFATHQTLSFHYASSLFTHLSNPRKSDSFSSFRKTIPSFHYTNPYAFLSNIIRLHILNFLNILKILFSYYILSIRKFVTFQPIQFATFLSVATLTFSNPLY